MTKEDNPVAFAHVIVGVMLLFIFLVCVAVISDLDDNGELNGVNTELESQVNQLKIKLDECQSSEIECWSSLKIYADAFEMQAAFKQLAKQNKMVANSI